MTRNNRVYRYCNLRPRPPVTLPPGLSPGRTEAIIRGASKWVNGTVLHYYFFDRETDGEQVTLSDGSTRFASWVGAEEQRDVVRRAFRTWRDLGIGLEFVEVAERTEAEIRIGFLFDFDGSWSYVGRDILHQGVDERTMNFGWDLTSDDYGMTTALHEIGHTIGLPHEHQNPFAGIVWDEQAVYDYFAGPPNRWPREQTFYNVLRKLSTGEVVGSTWDPDSVMEYAFPPGLITEPAQYRAGIDPPGTISPVDEQYVLSWYPKLEAAPPALVPFQSVPLDLAAGQQVDYVVEPPGTRVYRVGTFGSSDTVLVLFEEVDGQLRYVAADDDSGKATNAQVRRKLFMGRRYVVRLRCYYSWQAASTAIMLW